MLLLFLLVEGLYSLGVMRPGSPPIRNTVTNRGEYSNYIFSMIPSTQLPAGGQILVTFPNQFYSYLGIDLITQDTCVPNCSISGRTATFYFQNSVMKDVQLILQLNNVLNSPTSGGTGNFIVRSMKGQNIFDENLIFGTVTISDSIVPLSAAIVLLDPTLGSDITGMNSTYNFYIKTAILLPKGSQVQIQIPNTYQILDECKIIGKSDIPFKVENKTVILDSLGLDLQPEQVIGISLKLRNPPFSLLTQGFQIIAFQSDTSVALTKRTDILGVQIKPGQLQATLVPVLPDGILAQSKTNDFLLTFTTQNSVPSQGSILVQLPDGFRMVYQTSYDFIQVTSGLVTDGLSIVVQQTNFSISKFYQIEPNQTISLIFRCMNQQISGTSGSFVIQTYFDSALTQLIDEVASGLTFDIAASNSFPPFPLTLSKPFAGNILTDVIFVFSPTVTVPPNGYITLYFPQSWRINAISTSSCQVNLAGQIAFTCTLSSTTIKLQLPSSVTYSSGQQQQIKIIQKVNTPEKLETTLVDVTTYDVGGDSVLEVSSGYITLKPKQLAASQTNLVFIGSEISTNLNPKRSMISLSFVTIDEIPAAVPSTNSSINPGIIYLSFGPTSLWDSALGSGLSDGSDFPCVALSGLTAAAQSRIRCTLNTINGPKITVQGFNIVPAATNITIQMANILNPTGININIDVYTGQLIGGISQGINQIRASYTMNAQGGASQTILSESFLFSSQTVGTSFTMSFQPGFISNIQPGQSIIFQFPTYDDGFVNSNTQCTLNSFSVPCYPFPGPDWVVIPVSTPINSASNPAPTVGIANLKWPRTQDSVGYLQWVVTSTPTQVEFEKAKLLVVPLNDQFPLPVVNIFETATLQTYQKGKGYPGQTFVFLFKVINTIPPNAQLIINFPPEYDFTGTTVQCLWEQQQLPQTNINNLITLNVINGWPADKEFTIKCQGVETPFNPPDSISDGWTVSLTMNGKLMNQQLSFFQYTYDTLFTPGIIRVIQLQPFPMNQDQIAEYTISFIIQTALQPYSEIHITFPSLNYPQLPYPPLLATCILSGVIGSFSSCLLDGSTFVLILDQFCPVGLLTFYVDNIQNPGLVTTDGFVIETYFNGLLVDASDESTLLNRTITFTQQATYLPVQRMDFIPKYEGVVGQYSFKLPLVQDLTLFNNLVVTFPPVYDRRISDNINAQILQNGLNQSLTFTIEQRHIVFDPIQVTSGQTILIYINNVINPNHGVNTNTGQFKIGILGNGNSYISYNNQTGVFETISSA